jgi:multimeric flavodoxin WrbA
MSGLLEKVKGCNIIVYATPLYNYNMTSLLKAFQERLLPLLDPHLIKIGETYRHPPRYEVNRKMVLISTCGFPETSHFEGLRQVFRKIAYHSETPLVGELLMSAGDLLKKRILKEKFHGVLKAAYRAGVEVIKEGSVTKETEAQIQKSPISNDEMAEMVNHWWNGHLKRIDEGN